MAALLADGRQGRKTARGFYTYDGGKKRVDESVYAPAAGRVRRAQPLEASRARSSASCSRS